MFLYLVSPSLAYHMNEEVEQHAFSTYDKFVREKRDELEQQPPIPLAKAYYERSPLWVAIHLVDHDSHHLHDTPRPTINTLLDLFCAIRDDEAIHATALAHYQSKSQTIAD